MEGLRCDKVLMKCFVDLEVITLGFLVQYQKKRHLFLGMYKKTIRKRTENIFWNLENIENIILKICFENILFF